MFQQLFQLYYLKDLDKLGNYEGINMASTHDYIKDIRNENIKIYINGKFYHRSEAKISVFDSGFLLGDGVWEGIRLHEGTLIHLDTHIDRLFDGARSIAMKMHLTKMEIINAIWLTLKENNMKSDTHIRLIVSRGIKSTPYQHPKVTISDPTIVIIPEYKRPNKDVIAKGIRLVSVQTRRDSGVQDPKINSLSKMNCISACIEAEKLGAEEGLMLDSNGFVSTCNSTNFFIVVNKEIWTSTGEHCLNGVTRGAIIDLCRRNNILVYEKNFGIEDVYNADEAFVTGTFAGVIPVTEIDGKNMGKGSKGQLTKQIQIWYTNDIKNST
jgi:branched-chain amino acid aminotransferase